MLYDNYFEFRKHFNSRYRHKKLHVCDDGDYLNLDILSQFAFSECNEYMVNRNHVRLLSLVSIARRLHGISTKGEYSSNSNGTLTGTFQYSIS